MTHVVCEPCFGCKYTDCVVVCPVECFYEGEKILYIHPDECIDCEACVPECPVEAIFHEDNVPEEWKPFTQLNAEISVQVHSLSLKNHAKHVAIRRLYGGLRVMALVLGALMIVFAWLVWTQPEPPHNYSTKSETKHSAHAAPSTPAAPVPVPSVPLVP